MNRVTILIGVIVAALIALSLGVYFVLKPGVPPAPTPGGAKAGVTDYDRNARQSQGADRAMRSNTPRRCVRSAPPSTPTNFPRLKAEYIDTGKVFYVFRVFPIGAPDYPRRGHRALPAQRGEQYFPFLDMMYRSQDKWDPDGHEIPDVRAAILARTRRHRHGGRPGHALHGRQGD